MEIPTAQSQEHRRFVEIEWSFEREAFNEKDIHPVNSFLAGETSCPSCRTHFSPDPQYIDKNTVNVKCPECLFAWSFKVEALGSTATPVPLLLDRHHSEPMKVQKLVEEWEAGPIQATDDQYFEHFQYQFEKLDFNGSLEFLFGNETTGWAGLSNGGKSDFESIIRSLLNYFTLEFFRNSEHHVFSTLLEKTDVQRKSSIQPKETPKPAARALNEWIPAYQIEQSVKKVLIEPLEKTDPRYKIGESSYNTGFFRDKRLLLSTAAVVMGFAVAIWFFIPKVNESRHALTIVEVPAIDSLQSTKTEGVDANSLITTGPEEVAAITEPESIREPILESPSQNLSEDEGVSNNSAADEAPAQEAAKEKAEVKQIVKRAKNSLIKEKKSAQANIQKKEALAKPIVEDPKRTELEETYRQAMLHLKLQQSKEAIDQFKKALKIDGSHAASLRGLGLAFVYDQNFSEAIRSLETYLRISHEQTDRQSVEELIKTLRERVASLNK